MSESPVAVEFLHPSVEARIGSPLGETRLTDKGRLAVIFQAAALLSHLEVAGWRLVSTWQELMLDDHGLLRGVRAEPGPDPERAQHKLIRLTGVLFGVRDRIVGKGQAKRLASQTLQRWHRHQGKLPADRIVTHLLDQTSFLWQPMFAAGRRALIAELTWPQGGRLVVAGRGSFERRLLAEGCDRHGLEDLVAHQDARTLWLSCASGGLHVPPVEPAFDRGRRFYLLGRWKDSLDALVGLQEPAARVLQANCLHRLGKGASARRLLDSESQDRPLSPAESVERIEVRVSLHLEGGEPQLAMSLLAQHQLGAPRRTRLRLDLLAAEVAAKSGDWQAVGRRLSSIEELDEDHDWSWKWNRLMSRWAHARCDLRQAESLAAQALARGRRLLSTLR